MKPESDPSRTEGPAASLPPPPPCGGFGVAIICALPVEATAVGALFEERWDSAALRRAPTDTNAYSVGSISSHRVVIAHMSGMGKVAAATVAGNLRSSFRSLRLVLLVGVCGGAPNVSGKRSDEMLLGDVVVSTGVVQYDLGRRFPGRFVRKDTPHDNLSRLSVEADALLAKLQTEQDREQFSNTVSRHLAALQPKLSTAAHPGRSEDKLFKPDYLHKHHETVDCPECATHANAVCDRAVEKSCDELGCSQQESNLVSRWRSEQLTQPVVHFGLVASGDTVMRSGSDRDEIARRDSVIAFEMEGAGMWEILRACSCLIIKSVCDYADSHKNKKFQAYAAAVAAATAKALIQSWDAYMPKFLQPVHEPLVLSARNLKLLNRFKTVPYPDRKDRNPYRVLGTCEWFVGHKLFRDWLESSKDKSKPLWVSADPGCGKSVLAKYLVDEVLQTTEERTTCYFFFKDDFEDQKKVANAISCILHQVFTQKPLLFTDAIRVQLEVEGEDLSFSFRELWDLLLQVAEDENAGEILCVFDALDECESDDRQTLAIALLNQHRTKKAPNLKFLLTSRPFGSIRRSFQLPDIADLAVVHLSGENEAEMEQISKEIDIFIEARVTAISASLMLQKDEQDLLLRGLLGVSHRTYLWVYLTLGLIEGDENINKGKLRKVIAQLPKSVSEAYEKILSTSRDPEEARKTLHIIVAAETPLTLREMNFALALRPEHRTYEDVDMASDERFRERLRDICGLFVTVIESKVYLLHQTAKEFLVRSDYEEEHSNPVEPRDSLPKLGWKHSLEPPDSHRIIGQICLWLLQFPGLSSKEAWRPHTVSNDFTQLLTHVKSCVLLDYSASYWATHLRAPRVRIDKQMAEAMLAVCQACHDYRPFWFRVAVRSLYGDQLKIRPMIVDDPKATPLMIASYLGLAPAIQLLIKAGSSDLHATDSKGRTALAWAAAHGHRDAVKLLVDGQPGVFRGLGWLGIWKPAILEARDDLENTPLIWAVNGRVEGVVRLLLDKGADIEARDKLGRTPLVCHPGLFTTPPFELFSGAKTVTTQPLENNGADIVEQLMACRSPNEAIIKLLLEKGADIRAKDWRGETLLITFLKVAIEYGMEGAVDILLQYGVDIDEKDESEGKTPLMWAIEYERPEMAKLLIERNANIELRADYGHSAFTLACETGQLEIVRLLLEKGVDVNQSKTSSGVSALAFACQNAHEAVVRVLLEHGAIIEPNCHYACMPLFNLWGYGQLYLRQESVSIGKLLLDSGADLDAKDSYGTPILTAVAAFGNGHGVRWLLENGADIEARDADGETPLAKAVSSQSGARSVPVLLQAGADVNFIGQDGKSVLHMATVHCASQDVVRRLLDHGADVHSTDALGRTPLFWATERIVNTAIAQLLIEHGADVNAEDQHGKTPLSLACGETGNSETAEFLVQLGAEGG